MKILLRRAIEIVANRVNECKSIGSKTIKELILRGEERAWRSGRWKGIERTMSVKLYEDRLILPNDWNVLLAVNVGRRNHNIRSYWYEFDNFGPGPVSANGGEDCYTRDQVVELNDVCTPWPIGKGERLGVYSDRSEDQDSFLIVQGINQYGKEIYSKTVTTPLGEEQEGTETGERIEIRCNHAVVSFHSFADDGIHGLYKPVTRGTVYLVAHSDKGQSRIIGEMGPKQTQSFLKCYRLPNPRCCNQCVQALVKHSEPRLLVDDNDVLQVESEEALILLVMSAYYDMQAFDPAKSAYYFNQGLAALNGQVSQQKGGQKTQLRMDGMLPMDRKWNRRAW